MVSMTMAGKPICHNILKRELETVQDNAHAQNALGTERDTRRPGVGQVVSRWAVGIQHAKDDAYHQRTERQGLHPVLSPM